MEMDGVGCRIVFGAHKSCVWSLGTPFAVAEPHRWFAGRIRFVSDCGPPLKMVKT